jgi:hypothetical protein
MTFETSSEHFTVYHSEFIDNDKELMKVTFHDASMDVLAVFHVNSHDIEKWKADKTVKVINDRQHDKLEVHRMEYIIGTRLESCETVYVLLHNDCIVGKIIINKLTNQLHLVCKETYTWRVHTCKVDKEVIFANNFNLTRDEISYMKIAFGLQEHKTDYLPPCKQYERHIISVGVKRSNSW